MKYLVRLDGVALEASLQEDAGRYLLAIGDRDLTADVMEVEPGIYSILLNGRSYEAKVASGPAGLSVDVRGRHFTAEVVDPRRHTAGGASEGAQGRQQLAAPMPGKVVRVLASEGDLVEKGQGLIVVEAMKMQNEVRAPRSGRLISIAVRAGDTVTAGQTLASVE
jgi:biotin carboxyl carrier protein